MQICQRHHRIQGSQKWLAVTADFLTDLIEALIFPVLFTTCDVCAAQQERPSIEDAAVPATSEPLMRRLRVESSYGQTAAVRREWGNGTSTGTEEGEGEERSASQAATHER